MRMEHLVLIDGHHMMYRAYWAIPRTLKTSSGEQVNSVFGMASMLISILSKEKPDDLCVCFDEGDQTFRHQEHEEYKEGRAETPDDFYEQIPRIFELIDVFGFKRVSDPQYEADDLLASYSFKGRDKGMDVTIVSGDRDVFQLVDGHIKVSVPHKGYQAAEYFGRDEVIAKFGITPEQVATYKGLSGDKSDNLPGVIGIGPKTAAELIQKYDTMQGIYDHLSDIRPSVAEKLERDREQAFFCERMAVLETNLDLPIPLKELTMKDMPVKEVFEFFREMEFSLLTKRFQALLDTEYGAEHFNVEEKVENPSVANEDNQLTMF